MLERLEPRLLLAAGLDVVIIDSRLAAPDHLAGSVVEGAAVLLYDGAADSSAAVLARLVSLAESSDDGLASLSILSHGTGGQFRFGNSLVSAETLAARPRTWTELRSVLSEGANLYLFACNLLANGDGGQILIDRLADLTGADVFASDDATGAGGDWALEATSSGDEAELAAGVTTPFDMALLSEYQFSLAPPTLEFATFLGTIDADAGYHVAVDDSGDIYVTGRTDSADFPTTAGAYDETHNDGNDVFVTKFNADGSSIVYSTYLGGGDDDVGCAIAVDGSGNAYIVGTTQSGDFPTVDAYDTSLGGTQDAFVARLSADGSSLLYSTYYGGSQSDGVGYGAIALDGSNVVHFSGQTASDDLTLVNAYDDNLTGPRDVYVVKIDTTVAGAGGLLYGSYVGGTDGDGYDNDGGIAVDGSGNIYVTGSTCGSESPTTAGAFQTTWGGQSNRSDGFLVKLDPTVAGSGGLLYGTYLRGSTSSDWAGGVVVDASSVVFVTGYTSSTEFPTTAGAYATSLTGGSNSDAFLVKLNPAGGGASDLVYGSYIGGTENERSTSNNLALDSDGKAYVVGYTYSPADFPLVDPTQASFGGGLCDAFVFTLNPAGAGSADLEFSTYLGGDGVELGYGIALDTADNVYLTGYTLAADFPTTAGAYDELYNAGMDAFVVKYDLSSNTAPVIDDQSLPNVDENSANGTSVGTVVASDPDAGDSLTYTITGGNTGNAFAIDPNTGEITVNNSAALDFETNPVFNLTVEVEDTGTLTDDATVTINLNDLNETPDIGDATFAVDEDAVNGTDVGTPLVVTDPDAGDTTAWTITAGNGDGVFAIDAGTGQITVTDNTTLDYETTAQYVLTVRVTDSGALWDEAAVTVNVGDVNETPDINDATFAVDEDAANGTDVGTPLVVTDPDAGDTTAWTITGGNGDGVFAIDADTGQITVTDNTTLDYETTAQYVLTVRVTDSGALWDEAAVTVNVGDVNETPDIGNATFAVDEDAANGTDVGTPLAVTDPDAGDTTAWTITAGNSGGVFAIDSGTGQITVTDNTTLDFETTAQYVLTVRVTDSGALWDEAAVTVNVGDVNETPDIGDATFGVDEDAANGTDVGTPLAVTDPDAGDTTAWTITAGNSGGVFAIDADTGQITVTDNTTLDYETTPQYVLTVRVTDSGSLWDEAAVTVNVGDVNETPDIGDATFAVDEDAANGTDVGTPLAVTDPDAGDTTAWTITGGNGDGVFAIDSGTGQITVTDNTTLDFETTAQYVLTVRVTDSGALWDEADVTVNVGDVNETPDINDATFGVDEDAANGTDVGTPLAVTDPDAGDTTAWTITAGNGAGVFAIDAGTGQITVTDNTTLDFETTPQYVLTVRVTDSGGLWDEADVTVDVGDVNETPTVNDQALPNVDENSVNGTAVGTVVASDPDAGDSLTYSITTGNTDNAFAINATTGEVTVNNQTALDFETNPTFTLTVEVEDTGTLTDTATVTVNLNDRNDAPAITSSATPSVAENTTTAVVTVTATDQDGDTPTFAITGGADQAFFLVNNVTGELTFSPARDFEIPSDADADNVYEVQVTADDGNGGTAVQDLSVTVTNVNETPSVPDYPSPAPPPVPIDPLPPPDIPVPLPPPSPPDDPSPVLPGGGGGSDGGSSDSGSEDTATDEAPADEADEGSTTPETEPEGPAEAPQTQQGNAESKPATTKADDGTAMARLDGKGQDTKRRLPEPEPVTEPPQDRPGDAQDAPPAPSPFQKTAVALWQRLDATERQMDDHLSERVQTERITAGVVFGASSALTAGFVIWCVKSSALLFSALSSLPLWRWIDPVPVLESWEQARRKRQGQDDGRPEDDEDERVERLFD